MVTLQKACVVNLMTMDITKGILDDISRPASSERSRTGSRVSSASLSDGVRATCPSTSPRSLIVLSSDAPDFTEMEISDSDTDTEDCSPDMSAMSKDFIHVLVEHGKENEEFELQKALVKMKILDRILASKIHREKDVKKRSKELHQKLWQELQLVKSERSLECSIEAENTRLFWALSPSNVQEEDDFVPVFGTQVPDQEYEGDCSHSEEEGVGGEQPVNGTAGSAEWSQEDQQTEPTERTERSLSGSARARKKQDFVKRNIQLAGETGGQIPMTQKEKERLAELLRDLEKEEEVVGEAQTEAAQGQKHAEGEGFAPEPSELQQLVRIDTSLQLLLPVSDYLSVQSSSHDLSGTQVGECVWESDQRAEPQPGDKVLLDNKERREQEQRLQEITLQLEMLGQTQDMTYETPALIQEPQLRSLLEECELIQSQISVGGQGSGALSLTGDASSRADSDSLRSGPPHLSEFLLAELLRDAYTTSFSFLEGTSSPTEPIDGALSLGSLEDVGEAPGGVERPLTTNTD